MFTNKSTAIGCLMLIATLPAAAADSGFFKDSALRFGVAGGQFNLKSKNTSFNENSSAINLFAGYKMNKYLAIEGGWLGNAKPGFNESGYIDVVEVEGWHGEAIGSLPLNEVFSIYGRGGILNWKLTETQSFGGISVSGSSTGTDAFYGAGVSTEFEGALLRLEYAASNLTDGDARYISFGITWQFHL